MLLNFSDRTRTGVFNMVWPYTKNDAKIPLPILPFKVLVVMLNFVVRMRLCLHKVAWPSGLRRWFKAPVSSEAWVRIPPLPDIFFSSSGVQVKTIVLDWLD